MPTCVVFKTSAHSRHSVRSTSSRGNSGTLVASSSPRDGAGNARRSSLPVAVSGNCSSTTYAGGRMFLGQAGSQEGAQRLDVGSRRIGGHDVGHQAPVARAASSRDHHGPLARGMLHPAPPRSRPARSGSPRTFTWWSSRPRNSRVPPPRPHRSPVRYRRAPGSRPKGSGTNFSAVSSGGSSSRAPAPRRRCRARPARRSAPAAGAASSTYTCVLAIGPPIGTDARRGRPRRRRCARRIPTSSVGPIAIVQRCGRQPRRHAAHPTRQRLPR